MKPNERVELWANRPDITARCKTVFESTNLLGVRNLDDLLVRVAEIHGKPIEVVVTADERWSSTTALWIDYPTKAKIVVREIDPPVYRARGILHEAAHILFQHPGCNTVANSESVQEYVGDGGIVRGRILAGSATGPLAGDETIEGEAEYLAQLLSRALLRPSYISDERAFG